MNIHRGIAVAVLLAAGFVAHAEEGLDDIAKKMDDRAKEIDKQDKFCGPLRQFEIQRTKAICDRCQMLLEEMRKKREMYDYAMLLGRLQQAEPALRALTDYVKANRDTYRVTCGDLYREAGFICLSADRKEEAETYLERAMACEKNVSFLNRPSVKSQNKDLDKKIQSQPDFQTEWKDIEDSLKDDCDNGKAWWRRFELAHYSYHRHLDALVTLYILQEYFSKFDAVHSGEALWRRGDIEWDFGLKNEAIDTENKLLRDYPEHGSVKSGDIHRWLGDHCYDLGKYKEALSNYDRLKQFPDHWRFQDTNQDWFDERYRECQQRAKKGGP